MVRKSVVNRTPLKTVRPKQSQNSVKAGEVQNCNTSKSEVTIYCRAVQHVVPDLNDQIESLIHSERDKLDNSRKQSTSSEEMMDTNDESELALIKTILI